MITILGALAVALTQAAASMTGRPFSFYSRDPVSSMQAPFYLGALSDLTVLFWASAAAVALFISGVLGQRGANGRAFFLLMGLSLAWITADDLFLLHEHLIPMWTGLSEKRIYLVYAAAAGAGAWKFRADLLRAGAGLLALPAIFLSAAIAADLCLQPPVHWIEDGMKTIGAAATLELVVRLGRRALVGP